MVDMLSVSEVETSYIQVGNHSISFVDTTRAWQQLLESMQSTVKENIAHSRHGTELNLCTDDTDSAHEMIMPEYAQYTQIYGLPRKDWICSICENEIQPSEMKMKVDCRVCRDIFHLKCVRQQGLCNDTVCVRYNPSVGWSCHECDNVFGLLRE